MEEDLRHLVTRGRVWWLQLATPRPLRGRLPFVVQKSLGTKDLKEAQVLRWPWKSAYKKAWEVAKENPRMTREEVEAMAIEEHKKLEPETKAALDGLKALAALEGDG